MSSLFCLSPAFPPGRIRIRSRGISVPARSGRIPGSGIPAGIVPGTFICCPSIPASPCHRHTASSFLYKGISDRRAKKDRQYHNCRSQADQDFYHEREPGFLLRRIICRKAVLFRYLGSDIIPCLLLHIFRRQGHFRASHILPLIKIGDFPRPLRFIRNCYLTLER